MKKIYKLYPLVQHTDQFPVQFVEFSLLQAVSNPFHQGVVKVKIMHYAQPHGQHFIRLEQMADIRAGMTAASGTIAFFVKRRHIPFVFLIEHISMAAPGENVAMAGVTSRHDAVKQIHAPENAFQYVFRGAHPHEIPRLVRPAYEVRRPR